MQPAKLRVLGASRSIVGSDVTLLAAREAKKSVTSFETETRLVAASLFAAATKSSGTWSVNLGMTYEFTKSYVTQV